VFSLYFPVAVSNFRSYIEIFDPFGIVFCAGVEGSSFSLAHVDFQFSQHHFLKRLSFLQHIFLVPQMAKTMWISGSSFPLVYMSILCQYHAVFVIMSL
jgi:hypothetical protein